MTLSATPERLVEAGTTMRSLLVSSGLQQHFDSVTLGDPDGEEQILELTTAAGAFPEAFSGEVGVVANAFTLGADDVVLADSVGKPRPDVTP